MANVASSRSGPKKKQDPVLTSIIKRAARLGLTLGDLDYHIPAEGFSPEPPPEVYRLVAELADHDMTEMDRKAEEESKDVDDDLGQLISGEDDVDGQDEEHSGPDPSVPTIIRHTADPTSAAIRAFALPELVDIMLSYITIRATDILRCRRVNRRFCENIIGSALLQQKLFLSPGPGNEYNTRHNRLGPNWIDLRTNYVGIDGDIDLFRMQRAPISQDALWEEMLICQPPVSSIALSYKLESIFRSSVANRTVHRDAGIRFRDVVQESEDLVKEYYASSHSRGGPKVSGKLRSKAEEGFIWFDGPVEEEEEDEEQESGWQEGRQERIPNPPKKPAFSRATTPLSAQRPSTQYPPQGKAGSAPAHAHINQAQPPAAPKTRSTDSGQPEPAFLQGNKLAHALAPEFAGNGTAASSPGERTQRPEPKKEWDWRSVGPQA